MTNQDLFGPISQLGYLTDDIEATASAWTKTVCIGPWTLMRNVTLPAKMDGEDVAFKIDIALSYQNDVQIELIKPSCETPSPYTANAKAGLWGLHHVQFQTNDMAAAISKAEAAGLTTACVIESAGGGSYTYLRGPGVWFELMQANDGLLALFSMIKQSCVDWDGRELIREFGA